MQEWQPWNYKNYVSEFLSLKCAGDVLNATAPLGPRAEKEITEAMAVVSRLRGMALAEPMKYELYDLCAGNALCSVLAVHLLPIKFAHAVDKKPRNRRWDLVQRFEYLSCDIYDSLSLKSPAIIISCHPCRDLAKRVIQIYHEQESAAHLVLIPCCKGKIDTPLPTGILKKRLSKYEQWCFYL
ncbi:MAG: methyltransferase, partial [Planctomycetota bacterium]